MDQITEELKKLLEMSVFLNVIVLIRSGLKSLLNFPTLVNLQFLDLSQNNITDWSLQSLLHLGNLKILYLNQNKITERQSVGIFKNLRKLRSLCVWGNPFTSSPYFDEVFQMLD